ncbi:MAG: SIS domain-containing protein [Candidatus Micrarchaeota archaeon]
MIKSYCSNLKLAIDLIEESDVVRLADLLIKARDEGHFVYVFGNGDSANNATHFAADLSKGIILPGKKHLKIFSLNLNVPLMTAWANDISYENIFKEQLVDLLKPGDIVIALSGSGNSPNVLSAIEYANGVGAITVGISAMGGGKLTKLTKHSIIAKTDNMEIAEDIHWIIGHLVKISILSKK